MQNMPMPAATLHETVEDAGATARRAAARIEDTFLVAGDALGTALSVIDEAMACVDVIPRSITGEEMSAASETLWRISSDLSAVVNDLPRERQALSDISRRLDALRAPLERLVTSIRTIAILARSARVETAYLASNQLNFTEFAAEILTLADEGREGINAFVRDFQTVARLLAAARQAQSAFDDERREQIAASVTELQAAFDAIETRQQDAMRVSGQLAERSRRVSGMVGDCIMSLQVGDSTRQRLEHVDHALSEAVAAADDESELRGHCALQAAQLGDALHDFSAAAGDITAALGTLAGEADGIVDLGYGLLGSGDVGGNAAQGLHEQLRHRLALAATLIRECESARASVDAVMTSLTGTMQSFREGLGSLQAISRSITTVGLNAAIKSFRIGADGRGLAVISQDLRTYAEQIVDDTNGLISVFQEVIAAADAIERGRGRQDASRMAHADAEIGAMLRTIQDNERLVTETFGTMARSGTRVRDLVQRAENAFAALGSDMAPLAAATACLARQGEGGRLAAPPGGRYTMQREREIHAALLRSA